MPCKGHAVSQIEDSSHSRLTDYIGTRWYRSPEVLLGRPYRMPSGRMWRPDYGRAVDLWAVGCLFGEMMLGQAIFRGSTDIDQLHRIQKCCGALPVFMAEQYRRNPKHKSTSTKTSTTTTTTKTLYNSNTNNNNNNNNNNNQDGKQARDQQPRPQAQQQQQ